MIGMFNEATFWEILIQSSGLWWSERYLSKCSLSKHTYSWCDKLTVLWKLNRRTKIVLRLSSFVEKSKELFPANRIPTCLMIESLWCSVDFLKRRYMDFITYPLIHFIMFCLFSVNPDIFLKRIVRCNSAIKVSMDAICFLKT